MVVSQVREADAGRRLHVNAPPVSRPGAATSQVNRASAARLRFRGLEASAAEERVPDRTSAPQLERREVTQEATGTFGEGEKTGLCHTWMVMWASGYLR